MPFTGLEALNESGVDGILSFPLTGDFYFWAKILFGIWFIIASGFYFEERKRLGKGNMLASAAVASFAVIVLAVMGSLVGGMIGSEVLLSTIVLGLIFIFVWYIKGK